MTFYVSFILAFTRRMSVVVLMLPKAALAYPSMIHNNYNNRGTKAHANTFSSNSLQAVFVFSVQMSVSEVRALQRQDKPQSSGLNHSDKLQQYVLWDEVHANPNLTHLHIGNSTFEQMCTWTDLDTNLSGNWSVLRAIEVSLHTHTPTCTC